MPSKAHPPAPRRRQQQEREAAPSEPNVAESGRACARFYSCAPGLALTRVFVPNPKTPTRTDPDQTSVAESRDNDHAGCGPG